MSVLRQENLQNLTDGIYPDGNNLYYRVRNHGKYREWLYRCTIKGKATYRSLGTGSKLTLKQAREAAKNFVPEPKIDSISFKEAFYKVYPSISFARRWKPSTQEDHLKRMERYVLPILGSYKVNKISTEEILKVLNPIWEAMNPTASQVMFCLNFVFKQFMAMGYCKTNPVYWENNLELFLPSSARVHTNEHRAFIKAEEARKFLKTLLVPGSRPSKYLVAFLILTALRVGEASHLKWSYIKEDKDLGKYFDIPASLRKGHKKENHRLPITEEMEYILTFLDRSTEYIFTSTKDIPMDKSTPAEYVHRSEYNTTLHGFRTTFRIWGAENNLNSDACELILSHEIGNKVTRAYYRTDLYQERKKILTKWNKYLFRYISYK